jgi:transcriptional regulator of acetoin/glycerol metabolism
MRVLQGYPWPGNIRELRNFAENSVVLNRGGRIRDFDLDPKFRGVAVTAASTPGLPANNPLSVEENEKRLLREALVEARGNRTKAAQLMGISRRTLHRKLTQWPELDVADR